MGKITKYALLATKENHYRTLYSMSLPGNVVEYETTREWTYDLPIDSIILIREQESSLVKMICKVKGKTRKYTGTKKLKSGAIKKKYDYLIKMEVLYHDISKNIPAHIVWKELTIKAGAEYSGIKKVILNKKGITSWKDLVSMFK